MINIEHTLYSTIMINKYQKSQCFFVSSEQLVVAVKIQNRTNNAVYGRQIIKIRRLNMSKIVGAVGKQGRRTHWNTHTRTDNAYPWQKYIIFIKKEFFFSFFAARLCIAVALLLPKTTHSTFVLRSPNRTVRAQNRGLSGRDSGNIPRP